MINYEKKFYFKIDLQFFADGEKTEQPTAKKRSDARSEGQVAKSQEIGTAALFLFVFTFLKMISPWMYEKMTAVFNFNLSLIADIDAIGNVSYMAKFVPYLFYQTVLIVAPILLTTLVIGVVTNIIQVGWKPTGKPLRPKFSKLNPISGFKRLFSLQVLVELIKSLVKFAIIGGVIYSTLSKEMNGIQLLLDMELEQSIIYVGTICTDLGIKVGAFFIFIAAADYFYQRFKHNKDLKMTKQEIKDEYKNMEGDPHVKGQIKGRMREAAMRRMMTDIPKADVIITNPTHYAVAIKYDKEKAAAPYVVAKGVDHLARRIKEIGKENSIDIVENKPLARSLYSTVEVNQEIPAELYQAVAEVLAYVYNLKHGG